MGIHRSSDGAVEAEPHAARKEGIASERQIYVQGAKRSPPLER